MPILDTETIHSSFTNDSDWKKEAYLQFAQRLSDKKHKFPCIPATIGFQLRHFRYAYVSDPRSEQTAKELAEALKVYGVQSRSFGKYTSLIVFFHTPAEVADQYSVEEYRSLFWRLLDQASGLDESEWPAHIPQDPNHHVWEYCFGGEQYFMYCATPAHRLRQSRYFPYFVFAVTPRWVLQEFNAQPERAEEIKRSIRERTAKYDDIGIHPDLNLYGSEDNFEWKQYFLGDDDVPAAGCPFAHLHKPNG
ncbi:YqcI/YcgG family protein [Paenibacillus gansuensis]|uniref:YqcI/YcgG family protein n=1 Tax=Paenibacillus gansuensis TaxID=306542 RepID=A0ABW5PJP1_9BACL